MKLRKRASLSRRACSLRCCSSSAAAAGRAVCTALRQRAREQEPGQQHDQRHPQAVVAEIAVQFLPHRLGEGLRSEVRMRT